MKLMINIWQTNLQLGINEFKIYLHEIRFVFKSIFIEFFLKKEMLFDSSKTLTSIKSVFDLFRPYLPPLFWLKLIWLPKISDFDF